MKKFKILIAEDEEMLLELFEMLISGEFDCEITKAANGLEAIEILKLDSDFQIIISDYKMPKASGGDIHQYNYQHANLPFFLFSGGDLGDYPEFSNFLTVNPNNRFFNKPFNEKALLTEIKRLYDLKS